MASMDYPEHDTAIREWFAANLGQVNSLHEDTLNIYGWRHEGERSFTLLVTDEVLRHFNAIQLRAALDSLSVADALRESPTGKVMLHELNGTIFLSRDRS